MVKRKGGERRNIFGGFGSKSGSGSGQSASVKCWRNADVIFESEGFGCAGQFSSLNIFEKQILFYFFYKKKKRTLLCFPSQDSCFCFDRCDPISDLETLMI